MSRTFVGQKFNLPGVGEVTVNGFEKFTNTPGYGLVTDKGTYLYYDQDYVNKGAVFDGNQYYTPQLLEYLKNGQVAGIDLSQFDDDPTTTNSGRAIGQSGYIFTNPEAYNLYPTTFGVGNGIGSFNGIAKDANGNLRYVGYTGDGKNGSYTYEGANGIQTDSWNRSGSSFLGKLFGSAGEKIAASARDVLGNPIVQIGTALINPAAAAGIQFGSAVGSGAPIGDALKDAAKSYAIGEIAGQVGGAVGSPTSSAIANQAAQSAAAGATGGLLSGQDPIKSGLLAGAIGGGSAAIQSGANAVRDRFATPDAARRDLGFSPSTSLAGDGAPMQPGINQSRFNPRTIGADGLSPELGGVGLRPSTLPMLGGMGNGVGLVSALRDRNGNVVAYQGVNGIVRPGFVNAIGEINSYINDPNLQGRDVVQAGQVRNFGVTPPVRSELSDKAAERLIGGLLGGGAIAAGAGLLSNRGGVGGQMPQQQTRPLDQFQINPQVNKYTGDFETFGERGSQGFRFYNAPVTGLLG